MKNYKSVLYESRQSKISWLDEAKRDQLPSLLAELGYRYRDNDGWPVISREAPYRFKDVSNDSKKGLRSVEVGVAEFIVNDMTRGQGESSPQEIEGVLESQYQDRRDASKKVTEELIPQLHEFTLQMALERAAKTKTAKARLTYAEHEPITLPKRLGEVLVSQGGGWVELELSTPWGRAKVVGDDIFEATSLLTKKITQSRYPSLAVDHPEKFMAPYGAQGTLYYANDTKIGARKAHGVWGSEKLTKSHHEMMEAENLETRGNFTATTTFRWGRRMRYVIPEFFPSFNVVCPGDDRR